MMQKSLFIMMEYMNQGTLGDLLVKQMARPRKPMYTKEQALNWLIQIAHALNTLHSATPKVSNTHCFALSDRQGRIRAAFGKSVLQEPCLFCDIGRYSFVFWSNIEHLKTSRMFG